MGGRERDASTLGRPRATSRVSADWWWPPRAARRAPPPRVPRCVKRNSYVRDQLDRGRRPSFAYRAPFRAADDAVVSPRLAITAARGCSRTTKTSGSAAFIHGVLARVGGQRALIQAQGRETVSVRYLTRFRAGDSRCVSEAVYRKEFSRRR